MAFNFSVLKEPRGFIRVLEFIFSILAFATAASSQDFGASGVCTSIKYGDLGSDDKSRFEFFIATGVIAFLACIAFLVIYVMFLETLPPVFATVELAFTALWCFFWLLSSSLLASSVKKISDSNGCNNPTWQVSPVFGFINFVLWAGNIWFCYKETKAAPPVTDPSASGPNAV